MSKKMLISGDSDESRVAIVEDGRLQNLEIESESLEQLKGNLYKAIVHKVEPSLQAAFVDYGVEKQGFLPFAEIHPRLYPKDLPAGKRPGIQDVLKPRQEVLVQVVRDEIGNKGATLTTHLAMPGRYLVLMPESEKTGISRKLPDDERHRIKDILKSLEMPDGFGVIVRTAGLDCSEEDLTRDLSYLTRLWGTIEARYQAQKGPGLVFEDRSMAIRAIRDYLTEDTGEVWIDNVQAYQEVLDFVSVLMPAQKDCVRLYRDSVPLFIRHGVEDQIEEVFSRRVLLPSGGSIVIDSTEALVAIDVNSGRVKGDDIEQTAFIANMEAAKEIARQVIIRDLGGLIIVDFIDMRDRKAMREVESALRDAFKHDKARRKFSRISEFGLLEMSRQRLKSTLRKSSFERCAHCDGTGQVRTADSAGMYLLRRIREVAANGRVQQVIVKAPISVANFMVNRKRRDLYALEVQHETVVEVYGDPDVRPTQAVLEYYERRGRAQVKANVQIVDLVRSELVRQTDDPTRPQKVVLRDAPKDINYDDVYREIEEKHGKIDEKLPATRHHSTPTHQPAAAPPASIATPEPERRPKLSFWQRLFGVKREDPSPLTPSAAAAATAAPGPAPGTVAAKLGGAPQMSTSTSRSGATAQSGSSPSSAQRSATGNGAGRDDREGRDIRDSRNGRDSREGREGRDSRGGRRENQRDSQRDSQRDGRRDGQRDGGRDPQRGNSSGSAAKPASVSVSKLPAPRPQLPPMPIVGGAARALAAAVEAEESGSAIGLDSAGSAASRRKRRRRGGRGTGPDVASGAPNGTDAAAASQTDASTQAEQNTNRTPGEDDAGGQDSRRRSRRSRGGRTRSDAQSQPAAERDGHDDAGPRAETAKAADASSSPQSNDGPSKPRGPRESRGGEASNEPRATPTERPVPPPAPPVAPPPLPAPSANGPSRSAGGFVIDLRTPAGEQKRD